MENQARTPGDVRRVDAAFVTCTVVLVVVLAGLAGLACWVG